MTNLNRPRTAAALGAALLIGTALGAGGMAWSSNQMAPSATITAPAPAPSSGQSLSEAPLMHQAGFADLVDRVSPAVVQIATTEELPKTARRFRQMPEFPPGSPFGDMFRQFFGDQGQMFEQNARPSHALGSGFIIDPDGYIVTNNHVIDGAHDVKITLTDGSSYKAKIIGHDDKTDVALLKIDATKKLPYVSFGDSDKARVGDWVIAVGNPYGLGGTVTAGIISAHHRDIQEGPFDDFLQIDAPINPGNSGGPLFDQSGRVIGIDSAIYSPSGGSVGIGFAVPANLAKNIVEQLRTHGTVSRGWLGVQMQELTPALAKAVGLSSNDGVLVSEIEKDSPAAHSNLRQGDVITAYNGAKIKTMRDLAVAVAGTPKGKSATLTVWRDQHQASVNVTIGDKPSEKTASNEPGDGGTAAPAGMSLQALNSDMRSQLDLDPATQGVVITQIDPESKAADSGLEPGDVILRVGNDKVASPSEAANAIHSAERAKKTAVPLLVMRDGTTYYVGLQLTSG
ncbi:MAG TPA: DegQ family serine endoprotease [Alphaproteobacteria bacterium]|nr:DegQ family serine endoprotease [Alphaproteobacteria bacterium]